MDLVSLAVRVVRSQPYGFVITRGSERPGVRLVQPLRVDDDATVWFGTSRASRKAQEIESSPAVAYAAEDRASLAYAVVHGDAELVDDVEARRALWQPALAAFFPDGPDGDDFIAVRIRAVSVEVMSFAEGVHPPPFGLRAATASLR